MTLSIWIFRGASGVTSPLCGLILCSSRQRGPSRVWGPVEMGLAVERWRQWPIGAGDGSLRYPAFRNHPRGNRRDALFPCRPGSGGALGSPRLVADTSRGRSHPVAVTDGRVLRRHETLADGPRSLRAMGRRNQSAPTHQLMSTALTTTQSGVQAGDLDEMKMVQDGK